jgi:hypothetical protein
VTRALLATALIGALALGGCGGDDSGEPTQPAVSIPAITSPLPATSTAPGTGAGPATTTPATTTEGGKPGTGFDPNKPDSATNDVPPAAGSPEDAFEKHCRRNPEACG